MNDVCIVLEGSYPYVTGGVSTWVDRLLNGLPDVSFAVAHLHGEQVSGASPGYAPTANERAAQLSYAPPANVSCISPIALEEGRELSGDGAAGALPAARIYHALSSGAPAVIAAHEARRRGAAFLLTEHGLAWHEAALGISGCKPHRGPSRPRPAALHVAAHALAAAARGAYRDADFVTSVCAVNVRAQIAAGAPPQRCAPIPNPLPLGALPEMEERPDARCRAGAHAGEAPDERFRVALVGRVVPVKDVMSFLRAGVILASRRRGCELLVVGPLDHDPGYAEACMQLARELEIEREVTFTGTTDVGALHSDLDAVALCSVSEAQPLALLEAMAAGVPVVSTAVGGCPELLRGVGVLVPPGDHVALARALLRLADDREGRGRLAEAARARVAERHRAASVCARYRELYERAAARREGGGREVSMHGRGVSAAARSA